MQSHEPCPSAAKRSSADANPRTSYPKEQSDSTSAMRNGSSSSMTAIERSFDTHHPFSWDWPRWRKQVKGFACETDAGELYKGLIAVFTGCYCWLFQVAWA